MIINGDTPFAYRFLCYDADGAKISHLTSIDIATFKGVDSNGRVIPITRIEVAPPTSIEELLETAEKDPVGAKLVLDTQVERRDSKFGDLIVTQRFLARNGGPDASEALAEMQALREEVCAIAAQRAEEAKD